MKPPHVFKVSVCGAPGVGKSAFMQQLCENAFDTVYKKTVGIDFHVFKHEDVKFQFWDTSGVINIDHKCLTQYFTGSDIIIFAFDLSRPSTLDTLAKVWLPFAAWDAHTGMSVTAKPSCFAVLMGCKSDIKVVTNGKQTGEQWKCSYVECSALSRESCMNVIQLIMNRLDLANATELPDHPGIIPVSGMSGDDDENNALLLHPKNKKCCCSIL